MPTTNNIEIVVDYDNKHFNETLRNGSPNAVGRFEVRVDNEATYHQNREFLADDYLVVNFKRMLDSIERLLNSQRVTLTYHSTPITLVLDPKSDTAIEIWYKGRDASKRTVERNALFEEIIRSSEELLEYVTQVNPVLLEDNTVQDLEQSLSEAKNIYHQHLNEEN